MLLRLTSVRLLSLLWILSRVSSTLVGLGGSSGKILKGSAFTTPVGDHNITAQAAERRSNRVIRINGSTFTESSRTSAACQALDPHLPLSVCWRSQNPFATRNNNNNNLELVSYTLKMASLEEDVDRATRQACLVLSGNDCKDLQRRIYLRHFLSNWDVLGPIGGDCCRQSTHNDTLVRANYSQPCIQLI